MAFNGLGVALVVFLSGCQILKKDSTPEMIGGVETSDFAGVGILARNGSDFCTASLIGPQLIVTAAHCVSPKRVNDVFSFHLGPKFVGSTKYAVKDCVSHARYDDKASNFDIAYCTTLAPVPAEPYKMVKKLDASFLGKPLFLVGYGRNEKPETGPGRGSGIKRKGTIKITELSETKIKAEAPGVSSCNGDSGGPAFVLGDGGKLELAGVVSCGDRNCSSYGVFTRADVFSEFLGQGPAKDFAGSILTCPDQAENGICEGNILVNCTTDCFSAKVSKTSCAMMDGGSCYINEKRKSALCINRNWQKVTIKLSEVVLNQGFYETAGPLDADLFFDLKEVTGSERAHNQAQDGTATEMLETGEHHLHVRTWHSSSRIGISKMIFFRVNPGDREVNISLGKIPTTIKVQGALKDGEAFFITGEGSLLGDWKLGYKLEKQGNDYTFEDLLPQGLEYKIIKMKHSSRKAEISPSAIWQKGPNRKLKVVFMRDGIVEKFTPEF
jgi:hypothetical protein